MGHGKKKWIIAYDGKLKRSNDRTKKDYYRDLKYWEPMDDGRRWRWRKGKFCPQCRHVQKALIDERDKWQEIQDNLWAQYHKLYDEAREIWRKYHLESMEYWNYFKKRLEYKYPNEPKIPRPPEFWEWRQTQPEARCHPWSYDVRSFLCYKCERKYEIQNSRSYWDATYLRKHTWGRREDYRAYRNDVKNVLRRAKYDEEYYDDIPHYKRDWLD
jgi:hypothetical protein